MAKRSSLGKGLDALLGHFGQTDEEEVETVDEQTNVEGNVASSAAPVTKNTTTQKLPKNLVVELDLQKLDPGPFQARQDFPEEALQDLIHSIQEVGILQPLMVRKKKDNDRYEILGGERRFRAAQQLRLASVPAMVFEVSDDMAMAIGLIENMQRENLNPLEEAAGLERLSKEFGLTHEQIAKTLGKSRTAITNSLRLLTLSKDVRRFIEQGELSVGHAKILLGLKANEQVKMAETIIDKKLTTRQSEQLVTEWLTEDHLAAKKSKSAPTQAPSRDPDVRRLEKTLSEKLGARVQIFYNRKGKGKLVIPFHNAMELDGILDHIH